MFVAHIHTIKMIRPKNHKRMDSAELAHRTVLLATGQLQLPPDKELTERQRFAQSGGLKGGKARAESLTAAKRKRIAKLAANVRWGKSV